MRESKQCLLFYEICINDFQEYNKNGFDRKFELGIFEDGQYFKSSV